MMRAGSVLVPAGYAKGIYNVNARVNVTASSAETIVAQYQLPAGYLRQYDRLRLWSTFSKSGSTDTGTVNFKVGTAGTTADTTIYGGTAFNAASRTLATINDFKISDATHIQHCGNNANTPLIGSYIGVNSSAAYPSSVAISNISNSLYLTVTVTPGTTDDIALEDFRLEYISAS